MRWFWRVILSCVLGIILASVSVNVVRALVSLTGWSAAPFVGLLLRIARLPLTIATAGYIYLVMTRRWGPPGGQVVHAKNLTRRIVRACGLGLPVVLLWMWAWSYFERVDILAFTTFDYPGEAHGGEILVVPRFENGHLRIRYCRVIAGAPDESVRFSSRWGFEYRQQTDHRYPAGTFIERGISMPIWFLLMFTLPYPAVRIPLDLRARRIRNRLARGLCRHCGYDLRGNASGVCPECGIEMNAEPDVPARSI